MKRLIMNKAGRGLSPFTINLIMLVLFSAFLLTFIGNFIQSQNPNSGVLDEKYGLNGSINNMTSSISNFTALSEDIHTQLSGSEPTAVDYLYLIFKGAFYIPFAFIGFAINGISNTFHVLFLAFGGDNAHPLLKLIVGVISSALVLLIVLLIVKAIRTGESERWE